MGDKIRIQGNQYDFASTSLKIDGEPFYGFTAISWAQKRERKKAYGAGKHAAPRGRSRGVYSAEAKITMWRDSYTELCKALAAKAADATSFGDVEFPMVLQYVEDESNQDPVTVELLDVAIVGEDSSAEESGDPDKVEVALDVMRIKTNGLTLYSSNGGTL